MRKQVSEDLFEVYKTSLANYKNRPIITEQNSILRCLKGDAKLNINSSLYSLEAGENFFLMDTSFFQVDESSEDFQVEVCTFSHSILHDIFAIIHSRVIDTVSNMRPHVFNKTESQVLDQIINQIIRLYYHKEHIYRRNLVITYVSAYALEMYEMMRCKTEDKVIGVSNNNSYIINRFYKLLHEYHLTNRKVEFYAEKLNITPRYLHKITTMVMNQTPKQLIDHYVVSLAKRNLLTTNKTNQEIANDLNFTDQSSFGQFFKRNALVSPSEFRKRYK